MKKIMTLFLWMLVRSPLIHSSHPYHQQSSQFDNEALAEEEDFAGPVDRSGL